MMAIGDEQLFRVHDLDDLCEHVRIGDAPQPLPETFVILKIDARFLRTDRLFEQGEHVILRIRIQ